MIMVHKKKVRYLMERVGMNADGTKNYHYIPATPSEIRKYKMFKK